VLKVKVTMTHLLAVISNKVSLSSSALQNSSADQTTSQAENMKQMANHRDNLNAIGHC